MIGSRHRTLTSPGAAATLTERRHEKANTPDIVTLSESISGYGPPMAPVRLKPEHDGWRPAENNGTYRGNQPDHGGAQPRRLSLSRAAEM